MKVVPSPSGGAAGGVAGRCGAGGVAAGGAEVGAPYTPPDGRGVGETVGYAPAPPYRPLGRAGAGCWPYTWGVGAGVAPGT